MAQEIDEMTRQAWAALGGPPGLLERVSYGGPAGLLPSRLPVMPLARATVAACSLAAAELAARRAGGAVPVPVVGVDEGAVATAFVSERHLRIDGRPGDTFAPLSRFWPSADGRWVRTHANYPHHRARLLSALGASDEEGVAKALASLPAEAAERTVYAGGGLAVAVRTREEWAAHPQGRAAAAQPLVRTDLLDAAGPRALAGLLPGGPLLPAAGVRVLDLTRVIAGPVATRTLALLGADVLRVDPPGLPEAPDAHADTGFGKRSVSLDVGSAAFEELLAAADVVVTGYRPGALDRLGLSAEALCERRPGLIVAQLSAWGFEGPWSGRRGFDSLVQAAAGLALTEAPGPDGRPGALPAQALDHGTGYLLAAAVLRALTDQLTDGSARRVRLSLATTASWLTSGSPTVPAPPPAAFDPTPWLTDTSTPVGLLRHALPPVAFAGGPANWSRPPGPLGADQPVWL
ncbi:CoA transferase [Streptomyces sp.]